MSHKIGFTSEPYNSSSDPRKTWQERHSEGKVTAASSSSPSEKALRVLIKVKNLDAFKDSTQLKFDSVIQLSASEHIVTTQISKNQLENIRNNPYVISIEHSRAVGPTGSTL